MNFIRKNFFALVVMLTSILAFVFVLVLNGISGSAIDEKYCINTLGLIFGNATIQVNIKGALASATLNGGMSITGLISIISLGVGFVLAVLSMFFRKSALDYYGAVLLVVSGVLMLLLFNMGTQVMVAGNRYDFRTFVNVYNLKLGTGAIVYGITAIVGGVIGIFIEEKNLIR